MLWIVIYLVVLTRTRWEIYPLRLSPLTPTNGLLWSASESGDWSLVMPDVRSADGLWDSLVVAEVIHCNVATWCSKLIWLKEPLTPHKVVLICRDHFVRTVHVLVSMNPEGFRNQLRGEKKGDISARTRWSQTSAALQPPPYFFHCIHSLKLHTLWLSSPPSLFQHPSPTTGQFVPPAWLLPPLLLRYLAPSPALQWQVLIRKLPGPLCRSSKKPSSPLPATFNLITDFLELFRRGRSQEDNSRPSGFTNTLPGVAWFTGRGAFALLWHHVGKRSVILHKHLFQSVVVSPRSSLQRKFIKFQYGV